MLELAANDEIAIPLLAESNTLLVSLLAPFNRLREIPPHLSRHGRTLHKLNLGCNRIATLDEGVLASLDRLTELTLEGNQLRELPASIGALGRLRELWVHGNELDALPAALGRCASLTVLQCHHNRLSDLPDALATLTSLQGLYLQSNRLTGLARLRERLFDKFPLQNLALGANAFDLSEAYDLPDARVGLGWNLGAPPRHLPPLTDRFATSDHLFEPACAGARAAVLLVAFSAQGPAVQQWHAPCAALRAAGAPLDALYVTDPSNSFYLQDPSGAWDGLAYFDRLVRETARHYAHVLAVGSSMGATACLQHARLATRAVAFAPRVDLSLSHGSFVPPPTRAACLDAIHRALDGCAPAAVTVHVGSGNHVDVAQVACLRPSAPSLRVVGHDTFHHNVPQLLQQQGALVPLLKDEVLRALTRDDAATAAETCSCRG